MKKVNLENYVLGYSVIGYEQTEGGMDVHHHGEWMEDLSEAVAVLEDAQKNHKINNCDWVLVVEAVKKPCRSKLERALDVPVDLNEPEPENEKMRAGLVRLIAESGGPNNA